MARELIHRRVRIKMREFCVAYGTLGLITDAFDAEGFVEGKQANLGGQRRSLFATYENNINWADSEQVDRAIRVFEDMLSWGQEPYFSAEFLPKMRQLVKSDGYSIDDQLRIRRVYPSPLTDMHLDQVQDPSAIEEYLDRLHAIGDTDPSLAISYAKSMIESTAKLVLEEMGETYNKRSDLPTLGKAVQKALNVHPETIAPSQRGREVILAALGNLSQIVIRVAELRNEYGIAHGDIRPAYSLGSRHARLVVGMAFVYCRFLLDTLRDRRILPSEARK